MAIGQHMGLCRLGVTVCLRRSKALEQGLGWAVLPPASVLASQLVAIGSLNEVCTDVATSQVMPQVSLM